VACRPSGRAAAQKDEQTDIVMRRDGGKVLVGDICRPRNNLKAWGGLLLSKVGKTPLVESAIMAEPFFEG